MRRFADINSKSKPLTDYTETLGAYFSDVRKYKKLTVDEISDLFKRIRGVDEQDADKARETLVCASQRFVISIARCYGMLADISELISEGNVGLMKAIEKYDPESKFVFVTYAAFGVRKYMLKYISDTKPQIRRSNSIRYTTYHNKAFNTFFCENGRNPSEEELSGFIKERYGAIISPSDLTPISYTMVGGSSDEYLYGGANDNYTTQWINGEYEERDIEQLLKTLNEHEKDVILSYFGVGREIPESFSCIASRCNVSETKVKQTYHKALKKIKDSYGKKNN